MIVAALFAFAAILFNPVFLCIRLVIHTLRDVTWWANGTRAAVLKSRKDENYPSSVQVLDIAWRYKFDAIGCANFLSDFVLFHSGFENPEFLLRDDVSLYCITPRYFVFVQCAEGDSAWNVKDFCFSKEGQYRKARRVLLLPINAAYRLAEELKNRINKEKLIFIFHTGRCGSTLACQVFQDTDRCLAYAEPGPIGDLMRDASDRSAPSSEKLIQATVTLMCKPLTQRSLAAHVIKVQPLVSPMAVAFSRAFPKAAMMFLYRDVRGATLSYLRLALLPLSITSGLCQAVNHNLWRRFAVRHCFHDPLRQLPDLKHLKDKGLIAKMSVVPLLVIQDYLAARARSGLDIPAIRYEDLIQNPAANLARIFAHCGLAPELVTPALRDIARDSQASSPLAKVKVKGVLPMEFTEKDAQEISDLCKAINLPDVMRDGFVLPGTISKSD